MTKHLIVIGIAVLLLTLILPQNISADDSDNMNLIVGESTVITVLNETHLKYQACYHFVNPYNKNITSNITIDIPWIYSRGDSEIYGVYGNEWENISKNQAFAVFEKTLSPYESFEVRFRRKSYQGIHKSNDIYTIGYSFYGENFPFHKIEVRIPQMMDAYKLEIYGYNIPPNSEYVHAGYQIIRWEWFASELTNFDASGSVSLNYFYYFPLLDYLMGILLPLGWIIVAIIIGILVTKKTTNLIERVILFFKKSNKNDKKMPIKKYKKRK